ncbi:hypothetical protein [Streptomyces cinereoruber]|uniref:hypothetical protein n=1 Tax=Streptomyces cinereoruber TaxID=67260 RepID=UPI003399D81B
MQLLLGYPQALTHLLDKFLHTDARKVNDPYLFERLTVVAHGVVARTGAAADHDPLLREVAKRMLSYVYGDVDAPAHASVNALLCHAAGRVVRAAFEAGLVSAEDAARCAHPHPCPAIGEAPDKASIDARFPVRNAENERLWASLHASLLGLADFTNYEVKPAVSKFSQLPLSAPAPLPVYLRRSEPPVLVPDHVQAFAQCLPASVRDVLGTPEAVTQLLAERWRARRALTNEQYQLLERCAQAPTVEEQLADTPVDKDWASRWIFDNAVQRGWTPDRFAAFDNFRGGGRGREGHKAERVGKKYQWLGLHELVERLANHRYMIQRYAGDPAQYPGAGSLLMLDIDPTLPPAAHPLSSTAGERDSAAAAEARHATFPLTALDGRWNPPQPALPTSDRLSDWLLQENGLPDLITFTVRADSHGQEWVTLYEYVVDSVGGAEWKGQAEQWHFIHSWLLEEGHYQPALDFLAQRTLMGRWMPEIPSWHGVYLADLPQLDPERSARDDEMRFIDYADDTDAPPADTHPLEQPPTSGELKTTPEGNLAEAHEYISYLLGELRGEAPTQQQQLDELAARLSKPPSTHSTPPQVQTEAGQLACDADGQPLRAIPAVQEYNWSASGHDCSLDAPAGLSLPSAQLLHGTGLRPDPDNGDWYTREGTKVVRALTGHRSTGTISSLLIRRDWLEQRLRSLRATLLLGLFGERRPRTAELTQWREYSQTAGLWPGQELTVQEQLTRVRFNRNV